MRLTTSLLLLACAAALLVGGCATLHSASMRVEVEVYKGPLSKQPTVQVAELHGILKRSAGLFSAMKTQAQDLMQKKLDCHTEERIKERTAELAGLCHAAGEFEIKARGLAADLKDVINARCRSDVCPAPACPHSTDCGQAKFGRPVCKDSICCGRDDNDNKNRLRPVLEEIASFAARLRVDAFADAYHLNTVRPADDDLREFRARFANLTSELGSQLVSRADALLKQFDTAKARQLPAGVYLRDSAPTSMLNLFVWDWAMGERLGRDSRPYSDREEASNRVRALEHHFNDYYWSNINTVSAVGQGEFGMALVKDDIGNWQLKNYQNDPTEMIKAYRDVGLAALQEAAKQAALPGSTALAGRLVGFADRIAAGDPAAAAGGLDGIAASVHKQSETQLHTYSANALAEFKQLHANNIKSNDNAKKEEVDAPTLPNDSKCKADEPPDDYAEKALRIAYALPEEKDMKAGEKTKGMLRAATTAISKANSAIHAKDCDKAKIALRYANAAKLWHEAYKAQVALDGFPESVRSKMSNILNEHQSTITELQKAGLAAQTETKSDPGQ